CSRAGPTSRKSRSSGKVWVKPLMVTVTLVTVPWPATTMSDGYGVAGPLSGMEIGAGLVKATGVQLGVAVGVGVGLGVAVGVGVGPPARLNAPIRNRHPTELVVGTYSFMYQKVVSSVGSMSRAV